MSATFAQTRRALEGERPRGQSALALVTLTLLFAWIAWFTRAEVTVHEVSEAGRIEVAQAAHAVDAPVSGKIVATRLVLGMEVNAGDVLVELDAESERRRLQEERARLAAVQPELDALHAQIKTIDQSIASDRLTTTTTLDQARSRLEEAKVAARQADEEARRTDRLRESGAISEIEAMRVRTEADRRKAVTDAVALEEARLAASQRTRDIQGHTRAEDVRAQVAALEGRQRQAEAAIAVLEQEIDKRTIRAAVAGRIGEVATRGRGEYVKDGERLARIVPSGKLRAVAEFPPDAAVGRIRAGQVARLRLDGFPWARWGMVNAIVTSVGNELRDGKVKVELEVRPDPTSKIPLQHGLPGSVEVDVERATPAELVLRAVGRVLGRPVPHAGGEGG